jgi:hypothetical protein
MSSALLYKGFSIKADAKKKPPKKKDVNISPQASQALQASQASQVLQALQASPSVSVSNASPDNILDMVKTLQCDVKKLELNLKLVDSDNMSTEDYNEIKEKIISICRDDENTQKFFKDMEVKRGVNLLKRVVTYLQMIAPICGIINLTAVPYITSSVKNMDVEHKNALLVKCFRTFKMSYVALASIPNKFTIDDNVDMLGLIENAADVDLLDGPVEIANPVTGMDALKRGLFNVVNTFSDKTVSVAKKLLTPFKNNSKKGERYNLLIDKCNKLWSIVCLSMWLYIIFMELNKNDSSEDPLIIMTAGGGKKSLAKKRTKKGGPRH